ncbi:hypothetical protein MSSIT_1467 [Methanosarcina siciliae T4/M]|uniref:Uncharacterized protein n=2 Tax=Methanosarcina siciliae TaxID=38027 RepID=A0A0E3LAJ0_9EURY|nr:hypothetical protein MSSIT_1467 [Methanosarcina siciliae T4/M]AKB32106.1 hypothetical protein MSSIH_1416 [Methanosarcina siciliae HI350]
MKRLNLVRYLDTNIFLIAVFSLSTIFADLKLFFSSTKRRYHLFYSVHNFYHMHKHCMDQFSILFHKI